MKSNQESALPPRKYRELTDKDLNEITRAVGDRVRAQTIEQKERMKTSLQQELAAVRAAFAVNDRKKQKA